MNSEPLERHYTIKQIARRLAVSDDTVRRMVADGRCKANRIGRLLRVPASEARRLVVLHEPSGLSRRMLASHRQALGELGIDEGEIL